MNPSELKEQGRVEQRDKKQTDALDRIAKALEGILAEMKKRK